MDVQNVEVFFDFFVLFKDLFEELATSFFVSLFFFGKIDFGRIKESLDFVVYNVNEDIVFIEELSSGLLFGEVVKEIKVEEMDEIIIYLEE